jgi:hypothetical protein
MRVKQAGGLGVIFGKGISFLLMTALAFQSCVINLSLDVFFFVIVLFTVPVVLEFPAVSL